MKRRSLLQSILAMLLWPFSARAASPDEITYEVRSVFASDATKGNFLYVLVDLPSKAVTFEVVKGGTVTRFDELEYALEAYHGAG